MPNLETLLCDELRRGMKAGGGRANIPAGGDLIWRWFRDLCRTRTYHASGPNPISYLEIEAMARLQRWPLGPRHVEILRAMDEAWLDEHYSTRRLREGKKALPQTSQHAVSPDLFDAMFG